MTSLTEEQERMIYEHADWLSRVLGWTAHAIEPVFPTSNRVHIEKIWKPLSDVGLVTVGFHPPRPYTQCITPTQVLLDHADFVKQVAALQRQSTSIVNVRIELYAPVD